MLIHAHLMIARRILSEKYYLMDCFLGIIQLNAFHLTNGSVPISSFTTPGLFEISEGIETWNALIKISLHNRSMR